jgi:hypothetical protein
MATSSPKNQSWSNSEKSDQPWYKKWWVWTLGSVILVGAGIEITYSIIDNHTRTKGNYTFHFRF